MSKEDFITDRTSRNLMGIECNHMELPSLSSHRSEPWWDYFMTHRLGYHILIQFLKAESQGEAVRPIEIYDGLPRAKNGSLKMVGLDMVKKKLQSGIKLKIIRRESCPEDRRTVCYTFYDQEVRSQILHYCKNQVEKRLKMMMNQLEIYSSGGTFSFLKDAITDEQKISLLNFSQAITSDITPAQLTAKLQKIKQ